MTRPIVISCLFTDGDFGLHRPPKSYRSIFFTNNKDVEIEARQKGWEVVYIDVDTNGSLEKNSLLSKKIKFLDFITELKTGINFKDSVLYCDHKFLIRDRHVRKISNEAEGKSIVIRRTPMIKSSIWDEIKEATRQSRYSVSMPRTLAYISMMLDTGYDSHIDICNTGLIYYSDMSSSKALVSSVYKACQDLQQPECQIIWALHYQDFKESIRILDWRHPAVSDIRWKDPIGVEKFPDGKVGRIYSFISIIKDFLNFQFT